tara:strand:- start:752 stop:1222 length:471 start_codon:yes stop_codon:yes gene_type:complete
MAYVYSSREVQIAWSGVPLFGRSEDSFISIVRTTDLTSTNTGSDGLSEISRSPDETGTVTLSLQQGSQSNLVLSVAANLDSELVIGDLTIIDPSGSVFCHCRQAHLQKVPDITRGVNAGDNTNDWMFWCESILYTATPSGLPEGAAPVVSFVGSAI